jgi:hypothetical protein
MIGPIRKVHSLLRGTNIYPCSTEFDPVNPILTPVQKDWFQRTNTSTDPINLVPVKPNVVTHGSVGRYMSEERAHRMNDWIDG